MPYERIRPGAGWEHETSGYVVNFVSDDVALQSTCNVLDARTLQVVSRIKMPSRVPHGFHAWWVKNEYMEDDE